MPALAALTEALADESGAVRANAALALGMLKERAEPAVAALTRALEDPDGGVRANAALALRKVQGPSGAARTNDGPREAAIF